VSNSHARHAEDGLVAVVVFFAVEYPILAVIIVVILLVLGVLLMRKLIGAARSGIEKVKNSWRNLASP
jgi:Sec-independent protein translocase protein TatA